MVEGVLVECGVVIEKVGGIFDFFVVDDVDVVEEEGLFFLCGVSGL